MGKIVVTGAAGFIGSNLVKALNEKGHRNIIAVDNLQKSEKFKNLVDCQFEDYIDKLEFLQRIETGDFDGVVDVIFHQGACSDTMETDGRYMLENNYRYSRKLLEFSLKFKTQYIYASSASVYGSNNVFREAPEYEKPLNVYGYSKYLFDQVVRQKALNNQSHSQVVGLRYFNVYGPRESHKGRMASVAYHHYHQYRRDGRVRLFKGCHGYADGEQLRDFIYVGDAVRVNLFFMQNPQKSGVFNVGTGRAQTFNDVAVAVVNACRTIDGKTKLSKEEMIKQGIIEYIDFPDALRGKYQSFTQADISALRESGYGEIFHDVEEGVTKYMHYLQTYECANVPTR